MNLLDKHKWRAFSDDDADKYDDPRAFHKTLETLSSFDNEEDEAQQAKQEINDSL